MIRSAAISSALFACAVGCRDVSGFTTKPNERFEGSVASGNFVRSGVAPDVRMCLSLDTNHLQDAPGSITTSDGRFRATALRPIPQLWHDPLSTMTFGDGRLQNLIYVATSDEDAGRSEVTIVLSLMQSGAIEARLMRSAPGADPASSSAHGTPLFAVFNLERESGACAR